MRVFYFVGGPTAGNAPEFFRRLGEAGGPPPCWRIYRHASGDGRALHLVEPAIDSPQLLLCRRPT